MKGGPKPLSSAGFCTPMPWIGACRHGNNRQKCRWIGTACSLQRVKPETTSPTSHRSVPTSSDIWGESPPPEASPETNCSSKGIAVSELPAACRETPASCKILQALNAMPRNARVALKCLKCEKAVYRQCDTRFGSRVTVVTSQLKKKSKKLKKKSRGTHRICSCALKKMSNTLQNNE